MDYKPARWTKLGVGILAVGLLLALVSTLVWHPAKERYFNFVASKCSEGKGLSQIPWQEVLTFDVEVQVFIANDQRELAVIDCIDRWAGLVMRDHFSSEIRHPEIQFEVRGAHYAPPERLVRYHLTRPAD